MYRVVLVDDDKVVTQYMEKYIPWEKCGFKVVATYQNSMRAYHYLTENDYDVLITDIGMPHMNGIELISKINKEQENKINVILSCHDDFHFAQQAIKLDTFDFILKESMDEEQIVKLLKRLKKILDEANQKKETQGKLTKFLRENNMSLKSKFIEKVIKEPYVEDDKWWQEQENLLNMDFSSERYTVVLCFIDQFQAAIERYESETLLQFSINNVLEEVLGTYNNEIQIFYLHKKFLILFPEKNIKQIEIDHGIEEALKLTQSNLKNYLKLSLTAVIDNGKHIRKTLVHSIKTLVVYKEQRFYYQNESIQYHEELNYNNISIFNDYVEEVQLLKTYIMNGESEQLKVFLCNKINWFIQQRFSPKVIKDWSMKLLLDLKLGLNAFVYFKDQDVKILEIDQIQEVENFEEMKQVLFELCQQFIEHVIVLESTSKNEDALKAQRYVIANIDRKISLKDVSTYLHLNPSYFSRLYKSETGESFIEFVTRIKMEKAMELLDSTAKTVDLISIELGFDSKSYFIKRFRKQTGISPTDYKYKRVPQK
ncbi:response regulator [Salipaludibacillus sp. HK11]|uniref:response regulator transcription factor n=1 Tax=Salipaludibacillus sp. HK11 TaxID=3394320 RepID=UPI0039FBC50C